MNQDHIIGMCIPSLFSKANNAAVDGMLSLIFKWFLTAHSVLQGHEESIHRISCPLGEVFMHGALKPPNFTLVAVVPPHRRLSHVAW